MAFDPAFLELMTQQVKLSEPTSVDVYGRRTMGDPSAPVPCHIVERQGVVRDQDGNEVGESGRVYLAGVYDVAPNETVLTLPSGETPVIVAVSTHYDEDGPHHTVVHYS